MRHTCATTLFRHGLNAKQVQVWLGHHSPAFALATYVHLLPDDLPDATFLDAITGAIAGNRSHRNRPKRRARRHAANLHESSAAEVGRDGSGLLLIPRSKVRILHGPFRPSARSGKRSTMRVARVGKVGIATACVPRCVPRRLASSSRLRTDPPCPRRCRIRRRWRSESPPSSSSTAPT